MIKFITSFLLVMVTSSVFCQNTQIIYVSGTDKDHTVDWEFYCTKGRNSERWSKIAVPSCWEMQGFGTYHYGWEENFKDNETGLYRHTFKAEPSWKNKVVRIVFEGSMTDTEVKINGRPAGPVHQGSFYRFKYDITNLIKADNLLEVNVNKISADTSVNRAERMSDFWVFGGIFRPVYLEVLPQQFIDWTAIDAKADGSFTLDIYPLHIKDATRLEAQIKTLNGQAVGEPFSMAFRKEDTKVTLHTQVNNIQPWNPEAPNLYQVEIRLKNTKEVVHTRTEKFGFRTVTFKERDGFYVNGEKIMFKGVNRHSFWPATGRTTSKAISILDVNLIKEMNMNAVRMSHYPPDAHFLDVCDSLGLFVLDELGGWQKKYDTPVGKKLLKEMMVKDVNHPSIIIWDNGNEGGNNHDLVDEFGTYDPQKRKVIHPWSIFQGTDTQHYKGYDCCAGSLYHGNQVFFPTEMIHGLFDGGNGAGLNDHWNLMQSNPLSAGCFLWSFVDEGVVRADKGGAIDVKGDLAPDGIVGPYREKEGSFYTIKEIWSPVQIKRKSLINGAFDGTLEVENNYLYSTLDQVQFTWKLVDLTPYQQKPESIILAEGKLAGPSIAPRQKGKIVLPLPVDYTKADVLYVTAIDHFQREIFTWSWPLKTPAEINKQITLRKTTATIGVEESDAALALTANGITVKFDKKTGLLNGVQSGTSSITLTNGPLLAAGTSEFVSLKHYAEADHHVIEIIHKGDFKKIRFTFMANGILKLDYAYNHYKWQSDNKFNNLGISFSYPEANITGVTYSGRGPYRVWKNRMKGGQYNIWEKKYNNTITGESWDYPEFKGYYSDFTWVVIKNKEHTFAVYTDTEDLFLRLYTPQKPVGAKSDFTSPPFPVGDISFLNGISPIGTKFDGPENHGPEGDKNKVGTSWITGTLYFDFQNHQEK